MDKEKLIRLVREHRELYDLTHPQYNVLAKRHEAWQQIAHAMNLSPRDCKDKWKVLRDCFRRTQKLRRLKTKQGNIIIKKAKYERLLSFLSPHLRDDKVHVGDLRRHSSNDESSNVEEGQHSADASGKEPYQGQCVDALYAAPAPRARDKLSDFFIGLIQTVRDFPEDVQIRVKRTFSK